ncbi:hypothetical protein WJX81_007208 [Elliptochloris bilobata]|uniref:MBL fold metallo-hydrolase n=1 Tax=Elliptochloris bilobata TaxID=381761 RepID=A0AAW1RNJ4_9CHLO
MFPPRFWPAAKTRSSLVVTAGLSPQGVKSLTQTGSDMPSTSQNPCVCFTCGTQFAPTDLEPICCPICEDDRQYVATGGQRWTTHTQLLEEGYHNALRAEEPCVLGIGTEPSFAIGQRALLIQTGEGNILWDCVTVLDGDTRARIHELGGVQAIAISHPHFYSRMADWAEEFQAKRLELFGGATLLRLGGHFPGSAVLHWAPGADRRGILCTGDTIQAVPRAGYVSFMYSYPNLLPLPADEVERIRSAVEGWGLDFEVLYGGWFGRAVHEDAKAAVLQSADRYVGLLRGTLKKHWNS